MIKTLFFDPLRGLSKESLKYVPSLSVQTDRVQQNLHSWQNTLSLLKKNGFTTNNISIPFKTKYPIYSPDATLVQSSIFCAIPSKITFLLFLTILVTLVCIILLSSVTSVITSFLHQISNENFRVLQEIYGMLCHLIINRIPVSSTFLINKTARSHSSVVAVKQLSNL